MENKQTGEKKLDRHMAQKYRSVTMRAGYVGVDQLYIEYAAKELARHNSEPCERDVVDLKRLGRFLKHRPRLVHVFEKSEHQDDAQMRMPRRRTVIMQVVLRLIRVRLGQSYEWESMW